MFIRASGEKYFRLKDIVGVFDMDSSTVQKTTRLFLERLERENKIEKLIKGYQLPKSFIILSDGTTVISPSKTI